MANKIDAMKNVLVSANLDTSIVQKLHRANGFRNLLVHSAPGTSEGTFTRAAVYYLRAKDGEIRPYEVTLEKLDEWIGFSSELSAELGSLLDAVRTATASQKKISDRLDHRIAEMQLAASPEAVEADIGEEIIEELEFPPDDIPEG